MEQTITLSSQVARVDNSCHRVTLQQYLIGQLHKIEVEAHL